MPRSALSCWWRWRAFLALLGLQLYLLGATGSINLPYSSNMVNFGQLLIMPALISYGLCLLPGLVMLIVGLVTGLANGRNELKGSGWGVVDQPFVITNYPITGPIISGPAWI